MPNTGGADTIVLSWGSTKSYGEPIAASGR